MSIVLGDQGGYGSPRASKSIPRDIEGVDDRVGFDHTGMISSVLLSVENESHH